MIKYSAPLLEASEGLMEARMDAAEKEKKKKEAKAKEEEKKRFLFFKKKDDIKAKKKSYAEFCGSLKDEFLTEALKGIYLSALNERMYLNSTTMPLAEGLLERYIKENGGADTMMTRMQGKTYLLDRLCEIVEDAEEETKENVDEENPDTQEVPEETKEKLHDEVEGEEDVHKAIEVIAQRISDAEENFIKQNADDKKKIEDIAAQISDRLNAVKSDPDTTEETEQEIEQEFALEFAKGKVAVRDNRPRSVFEQMMRNLTESIVLDESLREEYTTDEGKLNIEKIMEATICMYGLLEMDNTLMINRIDAKYIENMLREMN